MVFVYVEANYHSGMVNNVYHVSFPTILIFHLRLVRDAKVATITMDIVVCLPTAQSHTLLIFIISVVCVLGTHLNKQMEPVYHVPKVKSITTTLSNAKDVQWVLQSQVILYSVCVVLPIKSFHLCQIVVNVHSIHQC